MNIGHLQLKNNVFLAPMAGITDLPFRTVVRSFGAPMAWITDLPFRTVVRSFGCGLAFT